MLFLLISLYFLNAVLDIPVIKTRMRFVKTFSSDIVSRDIATLTCILCNIKVVLYQKTSVTCHRLD